MKKVFLTMIKLYKSVLRLLKTNKSKKITLHPKEHPQPDLTCRIEQFIRENYLFRYNVMTEVTEYKGIDDLAGNFQPVTQRELNTFCMEARKSGINCWDRDISRYIHSKSILSYHPFREYMDGLPEWDGKDRVRDLARRVSSLPHWTEGFHTWMLGMASQWMQIPSAHANSVAPVLVSRRQGLNKSTFCRMLMPEALQGYYTDSFDTGATGGAEQKLTVFGLINLDELDKYTDRKMALLKSLMQMAGVAIRKAYKKSFSALPRIASFIATSNRKDLLTDPTGNRRFLCVEVEGKIDCSPIDHAQIYTQLKAELLAGKRAWFTSEEETVLMGHNEAFRKQSPEEDIFYSCFRLPENEETGHYLSAAQIFSILKRHYPSSARQLSSANFGKALVAIGAERKHTKQGNFYHVIMNR